ncbi:MAG: thioredoxin family protein [Planctomycetota bacterium]
MKESTTRSTTQNGLAFTNIGLSDTTIEWKRSASLGVLLLTLMGAAGCTRASFFAQNEAAVDPESSRPMAATESSTTERPVSASRLAASGSPELNAIASEKLALETQTPPSSSNARSTDDQPLIHTVAARMPQEPRLSTLEPGASLSASVAGSTGPVLLDFYATWCGPCRSQGRILHELEPLAETNDARIIKIDVDQHPHLARQFQVRSLPTLVVLQDGQVAHRRQGLTKADELASLMSR